MPQSILEKRVSRRNARFILRGIAIMTTFCVASTFMFQYLMGKEGKSHSFLTGVYWTFTTMTTLGLGDVYFESDAGKIFTVVVLLSGVGFILVGLPVTIYQLYQSSARIRREVSSDMKGHVVLTYFGPVAKVLIQKLSSLNIPYVLLAEDLQTAHLHLEQGLDTIVGNPIDPATYRACHVSNAAMVTATSNDAMNTSIIHAVRQVSETVPIISTSSEEISADLMNLAGASQVIKVDENMGLALARRTLGGDALAHVVGSFDQLVVAEATLAGTPMVGKSLATAKLEEKTGVRVIGTWDRGRFYMPHPNLVVTQSMVLIMVGPESAIEQYNELFCIYHIAAAPVLIVGAGNVGRNMAAALASRDQAFVVVERNPEKHKGLANAILGDATDPAMAGVLGIEKTPAIAITSHEDEANIYLTSYFRYKRPDVQILSRATYENSIQILHKAGCDFVMSYASLGANLIVSHLKKAEIVMVAEGVDVFRIRCPRQWRGKSVRATRIFETFGCNIVAVSENNESKMVGMEDVLPTGCQVILIGTLKAENELMNRFGASL